MRRKKTTDSTVNREIATASMVTSWYALGTSTPLLGCNRISQTVAVDKTISARQCHADAEHVRDALLAAYVPAPPESPFRLFVNARTHEQGWLYGFLASPEKLYFDPPDPRP